MIEEGLLTICVSVSHVDCGALVNVGSEEAFLKIRVSEVDPYRTESIAELQDVFFFKNELQLIVFFIQLVIKLDPDLLFCWDVERGPLYYLSYRAAKYGLSLSPLLGRLSRDNYQFLRTYVLTKQDVLCRSSSFRYGEALLESICGSRVKKFEGKACRAVDFEHFEFNYRIIGRVVLNMWRVADMEYKFTSYTLNNVYQKVFGITKPEIPGWQLLEKYMSEELVLGKSKVREI